MVMLLRRVQPALCAARGRASPGASHGALDATKMRGRAFQNRRHLDHRSG